MNIYYFLSGIGAVFVLEGVLPFMAPVACIEATEKLLDKNDSARQETALHRLLLGTLIVCFVHCLWIQP